MLRAMPERLLRAPGGEGDWNVAQAFAHTTAARRFLGMWAALDAGGTWPDGERPGGHAVDPGPAGRDPRRAAGPAREVASLDAIRRPRRIDGHELQRCGMHHPLIGRLRCGEWLLFLGIHDCMHLEQMQRPARGRCRRRPACLSGRRRSSSSPRRPRGSRSASHAAIAADGQRLLAAELSNRLGRLGAAVAPLPPVAPPAGQRSTGAMRSSSAPPRLACPAAVDAIGYAGGGALALLSDDGLDALLSPVPGEVVANNRFSADAFVVAGDLDRALVALEACETDNAAPRALNDAGFAWRDLGATRWARFDVDTTLDLALLRLATRLAGHAPARWVGASASSRWRGCRAIGRWKCRTSRRSARSCATAAPSWWSPGACRPRPGRSSRPRPPAGCACLIEERGMRSARGAGQPPRSILAALMRRSSPAELVAELALLGDAVVLDTRVLMAAVAESPDAAAWPPEEERFASDFGDASRIATPWLRELTEAAADASMPFLFGGHALVSDGLRLIVTAAWQGR